MEKAIKLRLKELRKERNIDQKVLAIDLKVSQPTISDWENNQITPSIDNIIQLAEYFGVSLDYLTYRSDTRRAEIVHSECWNGQSIRDLRGQRGETPEEIALSIGISVANYLKYESAQIDPPVNVLYKLADHFCVDIDFLLGFRWGIWENGRYVTGNFAIADKYEQQLVEYYRRLQEINKGKAIGYVQGLVKEEIESKSSSSVG